MPDGARRVLVVSGLWRIACVSMLLCFGNALPSFDTSGSLVRATVPGTEADHALWDRWAVPFVRWDTVYFLSLAYPAYGYMYENMLAFQPGIVAILRVLGFGYSGAWDPFVSVMRTVVLVQLLSWLAPWLLYHVTKQCTSSPRWAYRAAMLSVFAPASATSLTSPTPEPFFSVCSLLGLWCLTKEPYTHLRRILAALCFAAATLFRANGVFLAGFLVWHGLYLPWLTGHRRSVFQLLSALFIVVFCVGLSVAPFVLSQAWAVERMCPGAVWCTRSWPVVYTYVQETYWDVGFLRYWHWAQLPNFALAMPVLLLGAWGCYTLRPSWRICLRETLWPWRCALSPPRRGVWDWVFVYHMMFVLALLFFASHVQIALRFATPGGMPLLWWAAAKAYEHPQRRRVLEGYLVMYSIIACVLYAGFYPPA